jgi:hypothetical protein
MIPYRWPDNPLAGWWLGTCALALWAVLLGEISLGIAVRFNRFHIQSLEQDMVDRHHQSINALKSGDKLAYRAVNKLANEAYGKTFFLQLAMACSSLWPAALALAWLQTRFSRVGFPFLTESRTVGYPFIFIALYILVRILFGKIKPYLYRVHPSGSDTPR